MFVLKVSFYMSSIWQPVKYNLNLPTQLVIVPDNDQAREGEASCWEHHFCTERPYVLMIYCNAMKE